MELWRCERRRRQLQRRRWVLQAAQLPGVRGSGVGHSGAVAERRLGSVFERTRRPCNGFRLGEGLWGIDAGVGFRKCMYVACGGVGNKARPQDTKRSKKLKKLQKKGGHSQKRLGNK